MKINPYFYYISPFACLILILVITMFGIWLRRNNSSTTSKHRIPKVIHKVYIEHSMNLPNSLPFEIKKAHDSWRHMNPGYKIKTYGGNDCEKYLLKHFGKRHVDAFMKLKPYSYKCDFIRFAIIYNEGGIYTDWKTVCHKPIDHMILTDDTKWISSWDVVRSNMWTGFFVSAPKSPILKTAIDMCLYNIENNVFGKSCLEPTGPVLFGNAFLKHYPKYEFGKQINENGIILGEFKPTNIYFNNDLYLQSKCNECSQTQDWDKGNNYVKMWMHRDIYRT